MLVRILRAVLGEEAAPTPTLAREERSKLAELTLERAYTGIIADLAVLRADAHELAMEVREYQRRAEQCYSWLARLRTDLYEALGPEAQKAFRKQDEKRRAFEGLGGNGETAEVPRSPLDI